MFGVAIGCKGKQWMYLLFLVSLDLLLFFSPPFCYIFVRKGLAWNRRNLPRQVPASWTAKEKNGTPCRPNRRGFLRIKSSCVFFLLTWYNFALLRKSQWKAMFRAFINWQTEQWILQITYRRWFGYYTHLPWHNGGSYFRAIQSAQWSSWKWMFSAKHRHSSTYVFDGTYFFRYFFLWGSFWKHDSMQKFEIWSSRWQNANSLLDPPNEFET